MQTVYTPAKLHGVTYVHTYTHTLPSRGLVPTDALSAWCQLSRWDPDPKGLHELSRAASTVLKLTHQDDSRIVAVISVLRCSSQGHKDASPVPLTCAPCCEQLSRAFLLWNHSVYILYIKNVIKAFIYGWAAQYSAGLPQPPLPLHEMPSPSGNSCSKV